MNTPKPTHQAWGHFLQHGFLLIVLIFLMGCKNVAPTYSTTITNERFLDQPTLGMAKKIADGVLLHEIFLKGQSRKVWIYLPEKPAQAKIPCILIAPAGSRLFHGMELDAGDRPEHLPYVRAGYVVIAYELDGPVGENVRVSEAKPAIKSYMQSKAGIDNQQAALEYALAKLPIIDANQIYVVGHSSSATHALLVAESDTRIKGCIAFAAAYDINKRLGAAVNFFESQVPGFRDFIVKSSPINRTADLKCPVFLFHAEDDDVVSFSETVAFTEKLKKTNSKVTFIKAKSGGHYDPMIQQGIPEAIKWLKQLSSINSEK